MFVPAALLIIGAVTLTGPDAQSYAATPESCITAILA